MVGAGFAGLYLLHRLRKAGFTAIVLIEAGDVGGTWYGNRYPGARCDIQTIDYSYTFDPELETAWKWSEKYATQPEILRYLGFVTERYGLRRDIRFRTKVTAANWDQATERWQLATYDGATNPAGPLCAARQSSACAGKPSDAPPARRATGSPGSLMSRCR